MPVPTTVGYLMLGLTKEVGPHRCPPLLIPFPPADDPAEAAQRFLEENRVSDGSLLDNSLINRLVAYIMAATGTGAEEPLSTPLTVRAPALSLPLARVCALMADQREREKRERDRERKGERREERDKKVPLSCPLRLPSGPHRKFACCPDQQLAWDKDKKTFVPVTVNPQEEERRRQRELETRERELKEQRERDEAKKLEVKRRTPFIPPSDHQRTTEKGEREGGEKKKQMRSESKEIDS